MTLAIALGFALFVQDQPDPFEAKTYNVEFLTRAVQDLPAHEVSFGDEGVQFISGPAEAMRPFSGGTLVEMIRTNVDEDTWEDERADIYFTEGNLYVSNRRSVHEKIARYLAFWRSSARMIAIEAHIVSVEPDRWTQLRRKGRAERPSFLTAAQRTELLAAALEDKEVSLLRTLRATAHPGQRVHAKDITHHSYVAGHRASGGGMVALMEPHFSDYPVGAVLDVRPGLEPVGNSVTTDLRFSLAGFESMGEIKFKHRMMLPTGTVQKFKNPDPKKPEEERGETTGALRILETKLKFQLPRLEVEKVKTTVTIQEDETVILATILKKGRVLVFLLTPTIIRLSDPVPEPVFDERRLVRMYDISPLTRQIPNHPAGRLDTHAYLGGPGVSFTLEEPGIRLNEDHVAELIMSRVASDSWANRRNSIQVLDDRLVIRQTPKVLKEIDEFLGGILSSRSQMVTTEALVIGFKKGARAGWARRIPALGGGGYFLQPKEMTALLEEAARAGEVRLVERSEIVGFPQQRVHVARIRSERYLMDHDVAAVGFTSVHQPVTRWIQTGFVLDERPYLMPPGEQIAVELRASMGEASLKKVDDAASGIGPVQMPEFTGTRWASDVVCAGERFVLVSVNTRKDGEELLMFVRSRRNK